VIFDFQTFSVRSTHAFVCYKFSHLICLSYVEFGLCIQLMNQHIKLSHSGTVKLSPKLYLMSTGHQNGWSQWLWGLRCGSVATRLQSLWVQIALGVYLSAYCELCVVR